MNKNMLIVLGGGLLIAVLVAVLVQFSLKSRKAAVPTGPGSEIIVAAKDLPLGTVLNDEVMKWQQWPAGAPLFAGAIVRNGDKKPTDMIKGRLRRAVSVGEPIVDGAVIKEGQGNFIAATLTDGMRAVSINVTPSSMASGFIGPGDRVDVLLTYRKTVKVDEAKNPGVQEKLDLQFNNLATETIMQNVKVLAVDQNIKRDETKMDAKIGRTITIEVDRHGAEVLAIAPSLGTLSLALRPLGDAAITPNDGPIVTDQRVTHITNEVYDEAHKIAGQSSNTVRFYNGYTVVDQNTTGQ